jgi:two-component system, OmpR family, response regulator
MKLLLAEDDAILADALTTQLRRADYEVEAVENGAVAEYLLARQSFDAAILDLGLPLVDGLTVLKRVRTSKPALPVLVLTARDSLDDRVAGLNAGADDYLTKPFDFPELEARLRALMRRTRLPGAPAQMAQLTLDRDARRVLVRGEPQELSPREATLLDLLLSRRDSVVTKEQILQAWAGSGGEPTTANNAIEVYIHRLRRKIDNSGLAIRTVRGLGYLLEAGAEG